MKLQKDKLQKEYIKNLNSRNSLELCSEIREFLVVHTTNNGGHLSSNLGVVEAILTLHKVFDFPKDKIVFDVGHQSYVHKILSGRDDDFETLRKFGGMSGFPKVSESPYDSFNTGHSSTSISAALGLARARDAKGENNHIIAFIGDGALGGGMAFEALNDVGASDTKIIIVLNDNEMSINKNVGGLSAHLTMLRLNEQYINAKTKISGMLKKTGKFGSLISGLMKKTKNAVKFATMAEPVFECLGIKYIGMIDGHDIDDMTDAFEKAKSIDGPVIVHIQTKKGRGYEPAELNPDVYHGISPSANKTANIKTYTNFFGKYINEKASENPNVVVITAAMCSGCGLNAFAEKYPDRFFDVGIAEQHAVTLAAGMAAGGLTPVFSVYSTFLQRAYDQILHDVCLQNLHVVFAVDRSGIVGEDGETHQGIFDLSFLLHIPNMTVLAPSCESEFRQMLEYAIDDCNGPVVVRYPKSALPSRDSTNFKISEPEYVLKRDSDVVIFSVGNMLDTCIGASKLLEKENICSSVINLRTCKPLDVDFIQKVLDKCELAVTVEDNVIVGGAGQFLSESVDNIYRSKIITLGYDDCFVQQGSRSQLYEYHKLDSESIKNKIIKGLVKYE